MLKVSFQIKAFAHYAFNNTNALRVCTLAEHAVPCFKRCIHQVAQYEFTYVHCNSQQLHIWRAASVDAINLLQSVSTLDLPLQYSAATRFPRRRLCLCDESKIPASKNCTFPPLCVSYWRTGCCIALDNYSSRRYFFRLGAEPGWSCRISWPTIGYISWCSCFCFSKHIVVYGRLFCEWDCIFQDSAAQNENIIEAQKNTHQVIIRHGETKYAKTSTHGKRSQDISAAMCLH